jgi:hypothetical protein
MFMSKLTPKMRACDMCHMQGNHNFGTTSHCRVPLKVRGAQQRITPDVQTGCISCASGDGRFGGPLWWNTPLDENEGGGGAEENRTLYAQKGAEGMYAAAATASGSAVAGMVACAQCLSPAADLLLLHSSGLLHRMVALL